MGFSSLQEVNEKSREFYQNKKNDPNNWRLNYHIEPPFGLLNDPNGLCFYEGEYYIFFQWNPNNCHHETKYWGMTKTKDFLNYSVPTAIMAPYDWYDKNGCYSGGAVISDETMNLFYTGNVKDEYNKRISYQCIALIDKANNIAKKGGPVIDSIPEGYTAHFRDPQVFRVMDDYYMVIGAQNKNTLGRAVMYSSKNLKSWRFLGELKTKYKDFGYMWECPNIFTLENMDILLFSPQGLPKEEFRYQNLYQSGYICGKLNYNNLEFEHGQFTEMDFGPDFYAPQIFKDNKGRTIMYGWMGMPEEESFHPTIDQNYVFSLTIPRELKICDDKIIQKPLSELKKLRQKSLDEIIDTKKLENTMINNLSISAFKENSYEFIFNFEKGTSEAVILKFACDNIDDKEAVEVIFDFSKGFGIFDTSNMTYGIKNKRKFLFSDCDEYKLHTFIDKSSIEIFINDGKNVISSRIYPKKNLTGITIKSDGGDLLIKKIMGYTLGGISYV